MANGITHIQAAGGGATGTATVKTTSAFTAIGSGNSIVGLVNSSTGAANLVSISDNASGVTNTYVIDSAHVPQYDALPAWDILFWGLNIRGAPTTLTFTYSASDGAGSYVFDEYNGPQGVIGNDVVYIVGPTATPSITLTVSATNCTIWGCIDPNSAGTVTAGSGFTLRNDKAVNGLFATEDGIAVGPGSVIVRWNDTAPSDHIVMGLALIPPGPMGGQICM